MRDRELERMTERIDRIRKRLMDPRLRYMMNKAKLAPSKFDPDDFLVEVDENDPSRLNVLYPPEVVPVLARLAHIIRQRLAVARTRSPRRKRR